MFYGVVTTVDGTEIDRITIASSELQTAKRETSRQLRIFIGTYLVVLDESGKEICRRFSEYGAKWEALD